MKILILGYSDIVKRKILSEINSSKDITKIDIASRTIKELENIKVLSNIQKDKKNKAFASLIDFMVVLYLLLFIFLFL